MPPPDDAEHIRDDWNVPDWKDASAYPADDEALSQDAWRWEFIRRSEEYRTAWKSNRTKAVLRKFGLTEWLDPRERDAPKFRRPTDTTVLLNARNALEERMHYKALRAAQTEGFLFFSLDLDRAFDSQIASVKAAWKVAQQQRSIDPDEPKKRQRQNNTAPTKRRSRSLFLRVLDAINADAKSRDIADQFATEPNLYPEGVGRTAIECTMKEATCYWQRL